ncbi:MAG TPA: glucose-6-phosphate isomerase [Verrucomicrobiae bacterium]|nr:glucose-6-phosphate isomerase [Verrucomicrobiae bacterium]
MHTTDGWSRYRSLLYHDRNLGMSLDISRMNFPDGFIERMTPQANDAFDRMAALEKGGVANPDENRMVGHYWLRKPELAPTAEISSEISRTVQEILRFAGAVRESGVRTAGGGRFSRFLLIGIGGSALGPQFVGDALAEKGTGLHPHFLDNTDPDGFDRVLGEIGDGLRETLCVVISKSGGTKETRNGMLEARKAFEDRGIPFPRHAVAVTGAGSELDRLAEKEGWLARFPMWDWVGGRTSVTSAVGLLPAALQGIDIDAFLEGARECDEVTRSRDPRRNPAMLLALMWYHATGGRGEKDMVILPYKDRLLLFSRYLQQLVMESLGKERDLEGKEVRQGIAVYGNKGSTDQHAYVQQLREGVDNFFVTFIQVRRSRSGESLYVEPDVTSGDYLHGFLLGTRDALSENCRESMTLSWDTLNPRSVGALIALYERAVGFYAFLVNINAYHQPGVEAGKKAAENVLAIQRRILTNMRASAAAQTAEEISAAVGSDDTETVFHILEHLRANDPAVTVTEAEDLFGTRYGMS